MLGAPDPMGLPVAVDVVSGEQADDLLYVVSSHSSDVGATRSAVCGRCEDATDAAKETAYGALLSLQLWLVMTGT